MAGLWPTVDRLSWLLAHGYWLQIPVKLEWLL